VIIVVMGVAGSGKTTIGQLLASRLDCLFVDGDSFHPPANIEKMSHGIPLTDADREPWLAAIHARIAESSGRNESLVVACSALKQKYRDTLSRDIRIAWAYLKGSADLILSRLRGRSDHFMKPAMLASQIADLEEPTGAIVVDISLSPDAAVEQIVNALPAAGSLPA
jgi:gluconokinase